MLTPVRIQQADAVRAKLEKLGINAQDVNDAIQWARTGQGNTAAVVTALTHRWRSPANFGGSGRRWIIKYDYGFAPFA